MYPYTSEHRAPRDMHLEDAGRRNVYTCTGDRYVHGRHAKGKGVSSLDVSLKNQGADGEGKWRLAKACARALYIYVCVYICMYIYIDIDKYYID